MKILKSEHIIGLKINSIFKKIIEPTLKSHYLLQLNNRKKDKLIADDAYKKVFNELCIYVSLLLIYIYFQTILFILL